MPPRYIESLEVRWLFAVSATQIEQVDKALIQTVAIERSYIASADQSFASDTATIADSLTPLETNSEAKKAIKASIASFRTDERTALSLLVKDDRSLVTETTRLSSEFTPLALKLANNKITSAQSKTLTALETTLDDDSAGTGANWTLVTELWANNPNATSALENFSGGETLQGDISSLESTYPSASKLPTAVSNMNNVIRLIQSTAVLIATSLGNLANTVT